MSPNTQSEFTAIQIFINCDGSTGSYVPSLALSSASKPDGEMWLSAVGVIHCHNIKMVDNTNNKKELEMRRTEPLFVYQVHMYMY